MNRRTLFVGLTMLAFTGGSVYAQASYEFDFANEVKQGEQRQGFTNRPMVKTQNFTVGAIAVKDEIKLHKHNDGAHVIYIVSGTGTMRHGEKNIALKPGMVVHVPAGVVHGIKASSADLTLVDFAQPPFDPNKMEWLQ